MLSLGVFGRKTRDWTFWISLTWLFVHYKGYEYCHFLAQMLRIEVSCTFDLRCCWVECFREGGRVSKPLPMKHSLSPSFTAYIHCLNICFIGTVLHERERVNQCQWSRHDISCQCMSCYCRIFFSFSFFSCQSSCRDVQYIDKILHKESISSFYFSHIGKESNTSLLAWPTKELMEHNWLMM